MYPDGTFYEGEFLDNVIEGEGKYVGKVHQYEGSWSKGKMHGAGKSQWYNHNRQPIASYIGEYFNGFKHGFGEYTDTKGVTYRANWVHGEINDKTPMLVSRISDK